MPAGAAVAVARAGEATPVAIGVDIRIQAVSAGADRPQQQDRATNGVHGELPVLGACHLAAGSGLKAAKASPTRATTPAPMNNPFAMVASV